jgi:hypothetical protein
MAKFKFEILQNRNSGVVEFLKIKKINVSLFKVSIETIGYYPDEDEVFYDAANSDLSLDCKLDGEEIQYTLKGTFEVNIPDANYEDFINEEIHDISCDFYYDGEALEEDEDIEIKEPAPWLKISRLG